MIKERLCDSKKKKGAIYHKITYIKYRKTGRPRKNLLQSEGEALDGDFGEVDEVDELDFLLFFKTCVVDRDIEDLKEKLAQSIEIREKLIRKKDTKFHKIFPFYFVEPTLVSFC